MWGQAMPVEYNARVKMLMDRIEKDFRRVVDELGWTISLNRAEDHSSYAVFSVCRDSISHKFG